MLENTTCNVLCRLTYTQAEVDKFVEKIDEAYHMHWYAHARDRPARSRSLVLVPVLTTLRRVGRCRIVDNLPAAYGRPGRANYADGFPLGGVLELPDGTVRPQAGVGRDPLPR